MGDKQPASPRTLAHQTSINKKTKKNKGPKVYFKATDDYTAKDASELSFKKGQLIKMYAYDQSSFAEGALRDDKKKHIAFFPLAVVQEVTKDGQTVANSKFSHGAADLLSPRTQVVSSSLAQNKAANAAALESSLQKRPDKADLVARHIYEPSALSPEMADMQKKLEQAKTKDFLANFLRSKDQNREPLLTESAVDEFVLKMSDPKTGIPTGKHTKNLTTSYEDCLTGKQASEWLIANGHCADKAESVATMTFLLNSGVLVACNGKKKPFKAIRLYRFAILLKDQTVLNRDKVWHTNARHPVELSTFLLSRMLELIGKYRRPNESVDFDTLRRSEDFKKVSLATAELQKVALKPLNDLEREVFFVNVHNLLLLHTHVKKGVPSTMLARKEQYQNMKYVMEDVEYSREDIEKIVLSGAKVPDGGAPATPKHAYAVGQGSQPLWLFALSDGTVSCPFFVCYTAKDYVQKRSEHITEFLAQTSTVDHEKQTCSLPFVVKRLKDDFKLDDKAVYLLLKPFYNIEERRFFDKVDEFGGKLQLHFGERKVDPLYLAPKALTGAGASLSSAATGASATAAAAAAATPKQ